MPNKVQHRMPIEIGTTLRNCSVVIAMTCYVVACATGNGDDEAGRNYATWRIDLDGNTYQGHYDLTREQALTDMVARDLLAH
ncbi:MAG: hypothetical protein KAH77_01720 [Thiomargarita sp.]|nr:hypothetical protein [Thiomargarita sp.]